MATGLVKWFDNTKGFGFLTPDDGSEDLFAHYSSVVGEDGYKTLKRNQRVSFEVGAGEKGPHALNIVAQ